VSDALLFAVGSIVFFIGGAGVILALLDQFRRAEQADQDTTRRAG
jgi:hypothetical protein